MTELSLNEPITSLKGIGENQSKKYSKLNIYTIKDLLFHIPFRYRDTSEILSIEDFKYLEEGHF